MKKLPLFVYDDAEDTTDLIQRNPTELENGAVYVGFWNSDSQKHGRGKQFW
jgi:hypothetical protein